MAHAKIRRLDTSLVFPDSKGMKPLSVRGAFEGAVKRVMPVWTGELYTGFSPPQLYRDSSILIVDTLEVVFPSYFCIHTSIMKEG